MTSTNATRNSRRKRNGPPNFLETFRSEAKKRRNIDLSDEDLVQIIVDHWDEILENQDKGEFTRDDVEQMRQFVIKRTEQDTAVFNVKPCHKSIEHWIEMLEGLLSVCRAYLRIEQFLLGRAESRPQSYSRAPTLFSMLRNLPKFPRPNWEDPSAKAKDIGVADPNTMFIQMQHSFVYSSHGLVMLPDEVANYITRELRVLPGLHNKFSLTPTQKERLRRVMLDFKEYRSDISAWNHQIRLKVEKKEKERTQHICTHKSEPGSLSDSSPTTPTPFMSTLETYHFIAKLLDFYEPHPGPAFDQARSLLFSLRRELQKDLTNTLTIIDFTAYLS